MRLDNVLLPWPSPSLSCLSESKKQEGFLFNIPTARQVDPSDVNNITYINPIHMLETWNKINDDLIARNANEIWGTHDWTTLPPNIENQVAENTYTCGKIGVANTVTCIGQKKFLE
jgi:hypothetical protein